MSAQPALPQIIRIADLPADRATAFVIEPDAETRAQIMHALGLRALRKLRFAGNLAPMGDSDWQLTARLGATVVQDCVVTLDPVTTRIEEDIQRRYLAQMPDLPDAEEVEMPEDDSQEPLPHSLDLSAVMQEALALALPAFPRADGAALEAVQVSEPGVAPMQDEDTKPFANLKDLLNKS